MFDEFMLGLEGRGGDVIMYCLGIITNINLFYVSEMICSVLCLENGKLQRIQCRAKNDTSVYCYNNAGSHAIETCTIK